MADNITLPGTGSGVATDNIAGVKVQRIKVQYGATNGRSVMHGRSDG